MPTQQEAFEEIMAAYGQSIEAGEEAQRRLRVGLSGHQGQMVRALVEKHRARQPEPKAQAEPETAPAKPARGRGKR